MALSSYDKKLSSSQQAAINKAKNDYNAAMAKGDKAGMNAAHQAAESVRAQAGYSGGGDGSGYTKLSNKGSSTKSNIGSSIGNSISNMASSIGSSLNNRPSGGGGGSSGTINYGGQSFNMNTDYQKQINEANARGDYATAKNLEAIRNAKINYMNSIGVNKDGWTATNNYNFNSFSDLPSNWTSANIGGKNYINQDGRYYDSENNFLGTGWNANTGSFTYNNRQDAYDAATNWLASKNSGLSNYGLEASDYYDSLGNISSSFIDAMQTGDIDSWQQWRAEKKELDQKKAAIEQMRDELLNWTPEDIYTPEDENALSGNLTGAQNNYASNLNDYLDYISKQLGKNRVSVY